MIGLLAAIVTALFSIGVYTLISEGTRADAEQTPIDSSFLSKDGWILFDVDCRCIYCSDCRP
jgi:hypothetical protein